MTRYRSVQNQVEARVLIDPLIIERLKNLNKIYNGTSIRAAFYDENKVLIMIPGETEPFQSPETDSKATNIDGLKSLKEEVLQAMKIIDFLRLNSRKLTKKDKSQLCF